MQQLQQQQLVKTVAAVALASSALTALVMLAVHSRRKSDRRDQIKRLYHPRSTLSLKDRVHVEHEDTSINITPPSTADSDRDALVKEQLARNYAFLGDERMQHIRSAFVIVVGCGGVGSHAAHMLVRSGVQHIRLIDFDQVTLSSLNRHAVATHADVGTPKVRALARHFALFAPHARVDARVALMDAKSVTELLSGSPSLVLDCIDNIDTKVDLIAYCHDHNIPVVSSMGAGAKADPSRIQVADISETQEDPLARATRRLLRKRNITTGIPVVYSTEKPRTDVGLLPLSDSQLQPSAADDARPSDFAVVQDFRVRILPVLGTIPALFGCAMASYAVTKLAEWPMDPLPIKNRPGYNERLHRDLTMKERDVYRAPNLLPLTVSDVGYLVEEIWRCRSAVSGNMDKLALTRWHPHYPASMTNCILMTRQEVTAHDKLSRDWLRDHPAPSGDLPILPEGKTPEFAVAAYGQQAVDAIEARFKEEQAMRKWRDNSDQPNTTVQMTQDDEPLMTVVTNEELDRLARTCTTLWPSTDIHQLRLSYADYKHLRHVLCEASDSTSGLHSCFAASVFLRLPKDEHGRIHAAHFIDYVARRASLVEARLSLERFDDDGKSSLTDQQLMRFLSELLPHLSAVTHIDDDDSDIFSPTPRTAAPPDPAQLLSSTAPPVEFRHVWLRFAFQRLQFFLNPLKQRRIAIRDILLSSALTELFELRDASKVAPDLLDTNSFTRENVLKLHNHFRSLDTNDDGLLSRTEFARFRGAVFTPAFAEQVYANYPTVRGQLTWSAYIDLNLALDNVHTPQALQYALMPKILDVKHQGYLDEFTIRWFLRARDALITHLRGTANDVFAHMQHLGLEPFNLVDIENEIFDMARAADTRRITAADLMRCGVGGTIASILIDGTALGQYDLYLSTGNSSPR
ncbi:hypothetical protein RI367_005637 [Sorochytrium milnesiophthora]